MLKLKRIYQCNYECMPFYDLIQDIATRKYKIVNVNLLKPSLFFFEVFTPKIEGRRYILKIVVLVITIDSDGEVNYETQIIKDFNWKRNYRFISAQSAETIREVIYEKTKVDIK